MKVQRNEKGIPADIYALIRDAEVNGCWIFHQEKKLFFTPDEFKEVWEQHFSTSNRGNNYKVFKIVTPLYAVRLVAEWIRIANDKQQEVILKLNNYTADFKKKPNG